MKLIRVNVILDKDEAKKAALRAQKDNPDLNFSRLVRGLLRKYLKGEVSL